MYTCRADCGHYLFHSCIGHRLFLLFIYLSGIWERGVCVPGDVLCCIQLQFGLFWGAVFEGRNVIGREIALFLSW